jgi:transcriptional repressor NrdR
VLAFPHLPGARRCLGALNTMLCPACEHPKSDVLETRASGDGIRRRRQCQACNERFTTHERIDRKTPLIIKRDGAREPFDRDKVLSGLRIACRKRPVSARHLEEAASRVEAEMAARGTAEVPAAEVGKVVLNQLKAMDLVGYLRFASVYQEVQSAEDFLELLQPWVGRRDEGSDG